MNDDYLGIITSFRVSDAGAGANFGLVKVFISSTRYWNILFHQKDISNHSSKELFNSGVKWFEPLDLVKCCLSMTSKGMTATNVRHIGRYKTKPGDDLSIILALRRTGLYCASCNEPLENCKSFPCNKKDKQITFPLEVESPTIETENVLPEIKIRGEANEKVPA